MNILIFGGAGFVGRHYSEYFLKKNDYVKVIDNIAPYQEEFILRNGNCLIRINLTKSLNF